MLLYFFSLKPIAVGPVAQIKRSQEIPYMSPQRNQVQPAPNMLPQAWLQALEKCVEHYTRHGECLKNASKATRAAWWVACPLVCLPCAAWSCAWRFICCPLDCYSGRMCSNNGCTNLSDDCIAVCVRAPDAPFKLPPQPPHLSPDDLAKLVSILDKVHCVFQRNTFTRSHYAFLDTLRGVDCLRSSTPVTVALSIDEFRRIHGA